MDKILADLEDFTLPEKEPEPERDDISMQKIHNLLNKLIEFAKDNKDYENLDKLRTKFTQQFNRISREIKLNTKKTELILQYQKKVEAHQIEKDILLEKLLCKKPSRSISGISSITLVMTPYPNGQSFSCKHDCFYCPNEPAHKGNNYQAQPRSYLYHEPAVRRANRNGFLAFEQMIDRMNTLYVNGHTIDKLEIIVEGGTYTEYPEKYLEDFNRDTYYAANTYFDSEPKRAKLSLDEEVFINRSTKVHIIGICIETRPDALDDNWIRHFRKCGVTRIQLGVQSTHNHILKKINRGHTIECAYEAMEVLRDLCFKIDIHIMPDLPYTTPELDKQMFDYTYTQLMPDQIKVYPCAVVPWTKIEKWYNEGKWKPYEPEVLKEVMDYGMKTCPEWIRLPRVIRDIPGVYIQAGNKKTNLRQTLIESREIRSREIERHSEYYSKPGKIFVNCYLNHKTNGKDYFISYESEDKVALFGFIRLRLPNTRKYTSNYTSKYSKETFPIINKQKLSKPEDLFEVLKGRALIRELHVYGYNTQVGSGAKASQHRGIGTKLLKEAEKIAFWNGYKGIVVISGEGVKEYYAKKGYYEKNTFMYRDFYYYAKVSQIIEIIFTIMVIVYLCTK
jgi:ELP3 family radical SAM enzyme/protein acetyltransferase